VGGGKEKVLVNGDLLSTEPSSKRLRILPEKRLQGSEFLGCGCGYSVGRTRETSTSRPSSFLCEDDEIKIEARLTIGLLSLKFLSLSP
jgi:hypothetical protein